MRMHGLGILVVTAAMGACAPATRETKPTNEAALSCTPKPRAPGARSVLTYDGGMHVTTTVSQDGKLLTSGGAGFTSTAKIEITELDAKGAPGRRLRVHYLSAKLTRVQDDKPPRSFGPALSGKTFLVSQGEGAPVITDTAGQPVSDDVATPVRTDLGAAIVGPFARFLSTHPLRPRERLVVPVDMARGILHMKSTHGGFQLSSVEVTLKDVRRTAGRRMADLAASVRVESARGGPVQLQIEMQGTLVVDADTCRVESVRLSGPANAKATVKRAGNTLDLAADGTFSFNDEITGE